MIQSLNFRLADSLPGKALLRWRDEIERQFPLDSARALETRRRIDNYLDAGHGQCWLRRPEIAQTVEQALFHFDSSRYRLLAWCVMPNHVHVLIETIVGFPLGALVHAWKSHIGRRSNRLLGRRGAFWQPEYLDRYVRHAEHYRAVVSYIEENPVKAGLANVRTDWPWSSARFRAMEQTRR